MAIKMTKRSELRQLQDRWLNLPRIKRIAENHGEETRLAIIMPFPPSIQDVRENVYPNLEIWFREFLASEEAFDQGVRR